MTKLPFFLGFVLLCVSALWVGCKAKPASTPPPVEEEDDDDDESAEVSIADEDGVARCKHPLIRWLAGKGPPAWPTPLLRGLVKVSTQAPSRLFSRRPPTLVRHQRGLDVVWNTTLTFKGETCATPMDASSKVCKAHGMEVDVASPTRITCMDSAGKLQRRLKLRCTPASNKRAPGCTGGSCARPTSVRLGYELRLRLGPYASTKQAFGVLPRVLDTLHTAMAPAFLIKAADQVKVARWTCEGWTPGRCQDLRLDAEPKDPAGWIRTLIVVARRHGFLCEQAHRDPARRWIASLQKCSNSNMWYRVQRGRAVVRVTPILGGSAADSPARCSARHAKDPPPAGPADGETKLLGVPLSRDLLRRLDRFRGCLVAHHKKAGRDLRQRPWKRLGSYLQRTVHTPRGETPAVGGTVGTTYRPYSGKPASGLFMRLRLVRADREVKLYCTRRHTHGSCTLTLQRPHPNVMKVTMALPWKDAKQFLDAEGLARQIAGAQQRAHKSGLARLGRVQRCRVLLNGGQRCRWEQATKAEMERARKRLEKQREAVSAWVKKDQAALLADVRALYPLGDAACMVVGE